MKKLIATLIVFSYSLFAFSQEMVTISGVVSDYEGIPVDSSMVEIKYGDFETAYETLTNAKGEYSLTVTKGRYVAMGAMRMDEYPKFSKKAKEDQRLEFWLWNLVADKDMIIDIRYHRLEVYGINAYRVEGSYPGYMVYCRPMSLTKFLENPNGDLNVNEEDMEVTMTLDGAPVKINSQQRVNEYVGGDEFTGYLFHTNIAEEKTDKPYRMLKIVMTDRSNGDKGEALYFLENKFYERKR